MGRWIKKNYRLFSGLVLAIFFVGWTSFLNSTGTKIEGQVGAPVKSIETSKDSEQQPVKDTVNDSQPDDNKTPEEVPTQEATPEPTAEPTETITPEPTAEPTAEPTKEPTPEPTEEPTPTPIQELEITFPYAVANVSVKLNVRSDADEESSLIATMSPNAYCEVLEWGSEWTKIKSGSITGYAFTEYLLFNDECIERLQRLNKLLVKVTSNTLNIRSQPNTDCTVLGKASNGHKYMYLPQQSVEDWYCIQFSETQVGYMTTQYCEIFIDADTAVPIS